MAVDERSEVSFSTPQGTLPWQPICFGFIGFYPQNLVLRWTRANQSTGG